ncbi:MAG: hypothetical protein IIA61_06130 [Candidatus Marinimicrobia bacterium]|nr:hypothetical protein [Candidatus Neomarinimicrobiota bacterium]
MKNNKIYKIIVGTSGVIFLGALGSGLWEEFLKPLFHTIISLEVKISSKISGGYLDSLYEYVGNGDKSTFSIVPFCWFKV